VQPVQAQIVATALQHRKGRASSELRSQSLDDDGNIPVDQLSLQSDGRCRDHDGVTMGHGWDEICQRLPGASPRLDEKMLAGLKRVRDGVSHQLLTLSGLTINRGYRCGEQVSQGRISLLHRPTRLGSRADAGKLDLSGAG
jgi:hypothetical protein